MSQNVLNMLYYIEFTMCEPAQRDGYCLRPMTECRDCIKVSFDLNII